MLSTGSAADTNLDMLLVLKPVTFDQDSKHFQIQTSVRLGEPEPGKFRARSCFDVLVNGFARSGVSALSAIELSFQSLAQDASHNQPVPFGATPTITFRNVLTP